MRRLTLEERGALGIACLGALLVGAAAAVAGSWGPAQGGGGGGGAASSLSQVLGTGNTTSGNDINLSSGDELQINGSAGTDGQVWTSGGSGASPSWATPLDIRSFRSVGLWAPRGDATNPTGAGLFAALTYNDTSNGAGQVAAASGTNFMTWSQVTGSTAGSSNRFRTTSFPFVGEQNIGFSWTGMLLDQANMHFWVGFFDNSNAPTTAPYIANRGIFLRRFVGTDTFFTWELRNSSGGSVTTQATTLTPADLTVYTVQAWTTDRGVTWNVRVLDEDGALISGTDYTFDSSAGPTDGIMLFMMSTRTFAAEAETTYHMSAFAWGGD